MKNDRLIGAFVIFGVAMLALSGCATLERHITTGDGDVYDFKASAPPFFNLAAWESSMRYRVSADGVFDLGIGENATGLDYSSGYNALALTLGNLALQGLMASNGLPAGGISAPSVPPIALPAPP
jgi:hypothetical protein